MTTTVRGTVIRRAAALPVLLGALVVLAACGQAVDEGPKPQLSGADTTLQVRPTFYGATLADGARRTLYQFDADRGGRPTCVDACAQTWLPFIALGEPRPTDGNLHALDEEKIGTVTRADGRQQVTYAGHPLYYFADDAAPGDGNRVDDVRGAGQKQFGGTWSAVSPSGDPAGSTGSTVVPL